MKAFLMQTVVACAAVVSASAALADVMRTPALGDVRLEGALAGKMNRFLACRITDGESRHLIFDEALGAFTFRDDDRVPWNGGWRGEFWGKTMLSAVRVAEYLGSAALKADLVRECRRLMATVDADGYIGSYADPLNVRVAPGVPRLREGDRRQVGPCGRRLAELLPQRGASRAALLLVSEAGALGEDLRDAELPGRTRRVLPRDR